MTADEDRANITVVDVVAPGAITSIRLVTVFVSDHERAVDFYVNGLGLEMRDDGEWGAGFRMVEVAPPGSEASIVLVHPSLEMMGAARATWAREHVGALTGIVFETDDIEAAYESLTARGVRFLEPPAPRSWGGCAARLADPDGNVFLLVQPDGATDAEGGSTSHRFIEHVGEVEVELKAASEEGVFAAALAAFAELVDGGEGGEPGRHEVQLAAGDRALLLVDWLSELVYLAEVEEFVPERVTDFELGGSRLRATVEGRRGRPRHLVKAVTLNRLELAEKEGYWHGRVVLDV